ncbi:hypothetical protein [uncultured Pseudokineococcus sp.]|uniref:hypothetical protein n=1 Tax=uncultured Pseudokineococcus sp. TaxID=1642928 RepID=UPI0026321FD2|nr:hypothetical protein [uncultured Pseudokineococcus sp.]
MADARAGSSGAPAAGDVVVLLVAGSGRSGSTLLASALGQLPGAFCAGELRFLWQRGVVEDHRCGCGDPFSRCPVWTAVLADVRRAHPELDPAGLAERLRRRMRARRLPRLLARRALGLPPVPPSPDDAVLAELYAAIARTTGCRVVVDPSKLPLYGLLLQQLPGVDLRVVHLVRDPRATAWSWRRRKPTGDRAGAGALMPRPGLVRSSVLWVLWNVVAALAWPPAPGAPAGATPLPRPPGRASSTRRPAVRVRYEDLVADPAGALRAAAGVAGLPAEHLPLRGGGGAPVEAVLAPTHTVAGNPDRHRSGPVVLREDDEWRRAMPRRARALVGALTAPGRLVLRTRGDRTAPAAAVRSAAAADGAAS